MAPAAAQARGAGGDSYGDDNNGDDSGNESGSGEEHAPEYDMPNKLVHVYMNCELQDKISTLFSFARTHTKCRILAFMSSCKQVCRESVARATRVNCLGRRDRKPQRRIKDAENTAPILHSLNH